MLNGVSVRFSRTNGVGVIFGIRDRRIVKITLTPSLPTLPRRQRGFLQLAAQLVVMLIMVVLALNFVWWIIREENFTQVAVVIWAIGAVVAYFITLENVVVVLVPAGFAVFVLMSAATVPLTWLAESKLGLLALLASQLAFCFYAGRALSRWLRSHVLSRFPPGTEERWTVQGADFFANLGRWGLLAFAALLFLVPAPLMFFLLVSVAVDMTTPDYVRASALWGLGAVAWYGYRLGVARWWRVPACVWIYLAVTAAIMAVDAIAGPFVEGTGLQVAYTALPGALVAAFVEVFIFGGGRIDEPESERNPPDQQ